MTGLLSLVVGIAVGWLFWGDVAGLASATTGGQSVEQGQRSARAGVQGSPGGGRQTLRRGGHGRGGHGRGGHGRGGHGGHGGGGHGHGRHGVAPGLEQVMGKLSRQLTLDRGQQAELRTILKEREQTIRTFRRALLIQTNRVDRLPVGADGRADQIERHVRDIQTAIDAQLQLLADSRERIYAMLNDRQRTRLDLIRRSGLYTGPVSHWP